MAIEKDSDDVMKITFHIKQNGKPVSKEVHMTRQTFLDYNAKPKKNWAEMCEMIVRDKAYIKIIDVSNGN